MYNLHFFLRVLISNVLAMGNNTAEYYKAGIHIVLSDALVNVDPSACDQTCMEGRLMEAREDGVWRGWQVMTLVESNLYLSHATFNKQKHCYSGSIGRLILHIW